MKPTSTYREGKKRVFDDLEYYPCCGFVRVHDRRDGSTKDVNPFDFQKRAEVLGKAIARIKASDKDAHKDKVRLAAMANDAIECAREAAEMGSPFDPRVVEYWQKHKTYKPVYCNGASFGDAGMRLSPGGLLIPGDLR